MISQILRELIAAGLQGETLVAAVERIEQAQPKAIDATAERRRAKDRERYRQKHPKPPNSTETTETVELSLTSTSSLVSITKETESKEVIKKERARKTQLPADWKPNQSHYALAEKFKHPEGYVDLKADALRDWALGKGVMRADWDRTFNAFLRPREGTSNGHGGPRPLQDDSKSISRAAGRLAERAERGEQIWGPPPSLLPSDDASPVRLLPKR